jgi:hypothetical protein
VNFRPLTVARFGIYAAVAVAAMSIWLGQRAGASLDYTLLRGVFVFVIFTALGFGAEAILTVAWQPPEPPAPTPPAADSAREEQV